MNSVSVVIPVFNEEKNLRELATRLSTVLQGTGISWEVVFVDDGSRDRTWELGQEIAASDSRFHMLALARNFGHQVAVSAGLAHARGDAVVLMDGDLQDPPEVLPDMISRLNSGYDVVYAVRRKRKENLFKRTAYWAFYRILAQLSPIPVALDSGDFCIMSRRVVDILVSMPERNRFLRGMRAWVGFRQTDLEYERGARFAGESKYPFRKLVALALDGILAMSEKPLRFATWMGLAVAGLSILAAFRVLFWRLFHPEELPGYASLSVGIFFIGGLQLLAIGVMGEYIARIHNEVKQRPLFLVRDHAGVGLPAAAGSPVHQRSDLRSAS